MDRQAGQYTTILGRILAVNRNPQRLRGNHYLGGLEPTITQQKSGYLLDRIEAKKEFPKSEARWNVTNKPSRVRRGLISSVGQW